jgi:hypothetical protein
MDFTALGAAVNIGARLQLRPFAGEVVLSSDVCALVETDHPSARRDRRRRTRTRRLSSDTSDAEDSSFGERRAPAGRRHLDLVSGLATAISNEGEDVMSVVKIIEVVGRSSTSSDDAVKSALAEASRSLRNIKALDVVSVGLRGDNLDEWGALVRISFLVDNVTD